MEFYLREYYRLDEHQVRRNIENIRMPLTKDEKAMQQKLKEKYIREFE